MQIPYAHILICRTDNIGDVVLTLPLAGYLKKLYPGARVDFLCRAYAAPLVENCVFVDEVLVLEDLEDPAAYFKTAGVDAIIFAFPNRRLALAAKRAGVRNRVGSSHRWFHWFTCNKLAHFSRANSCYHEAQLNFALLAPLGIEHMPALVALPPLFGLSAPRLPAVVARLVPGRFNLILHTKSNGNGREWPLEHYAALAHALLEYADVHIWLTGSTAEGAAIAAAAPALLAAPNVSDLCGRLTLEELMALINACDGLVASGTGPLHMSAALGRPTLGLFPPIKPIHPGRWGTLGAKAQTLCVDEPCAACVNAARCACMLAITPERVVAVVLGWLARRGALAAG